MIRFLKSLLSKGDDPREQPANAPANPNTPQLPECGLDEVWAVDGIDLTAPSQDRFAKDVLAKHAGDQLKTALLNPRFAAAPRNFSQLDAAVLHGLVTEHEPSRIMEIGSGASSFLIRNAIKLKNLPAEFIIVEEELTPDFVDLYDAHLDDPLTDVPPSDFEIMIAGEMVIAHLDQLSTRPPHLAHLFNDLLPALVPGIYVAFAGMGNKVANAAVRDWLPTQPKSEILFCGPMLLAGESDALGKLPDWLDKSDSTMLLLKLA